MEASKNKVLLIGWDAADWKVINPLLDSGQLPALAKIINKGVIGNIMTLDPPLSPMLWTSIATGKRADKHGIIGFMEPDMVNGGIRSINVTSRKTRALWNILSGVGKKSNVVGWWPSHPAEPINGVMVSNFFHKFRKDKETNKWPLIKGCISPEELKSELIRMRIAPSELTQAHVLPFIPKAAEIKEENKKRLNALAKVIAENATVHATATWLMENTEWDLMAIYYDGIDHACHGFMKFHPPKLPGMPDDLFDMFKDVVSGMYIFHDMMLERLIDLAGKDTTVIILSDHGFHSDHLRKIDLPKHAAAPALDHRQYGILCMAGKNIQQDERIYGASLLDITPTILTIFGLPVGKDMDGKVIANAFINPVKTEFVESWDAIEGNFGTHPENMQEDAYASAEAMKQLVELGYVEDFGEDKAKAMEQTVIESKYNLARVFINKNDYKSAIPLLEELITADNKDARFLLALSKCWLSLKEYDKSQELINQLREIDNKFIPNIDLLEAMLNNQKGRYREAFELLKKAEKNLKPSSSLFAELGRVYLKMNKIEDARHSFIASLEIDSGNAYAYFGLGQALLKMKQYEGASDSFLNAIGLTFHFPLAHTKLGEALYMQEKHVEASLAFELALTMAPRMVKPRQWLIKIYSENILDEEKFNKHKIIVEKLNKGTIYVVSGLPRSGTSMMMQMLQAGGMEIFTDNKRSADDNNPRGYLEHEAVKSLAKDKSWLPQADGKTVKIIAQLLQHLPPDYRYKIIFMRRDMNEILKSQQKMLGKDQSTFPMGIANVFNKTIDKVDEWVKLSPNVDILYLNYKDVIENPFESVEKISDYLAIQLDTENMCDAIMPDLYRNKSQA